MSEGELLQLEKTRTLAIPEEVYYDIIRNKTASLLASACAAGAWSSSNNEEKTEKMRAFGEYVGMAFQIKDDLFDYASDKIGKPTGNDIKEKKLTLPLIYTLKNCTKETRREIIYIIKNKNTDTAQVKKVADIVTRSGGIQYASDKMNEFYTKAKDILCQFPNDDSRKGLEDLVNFVINRKY
jgi:octaprenyl-diphosphate synthase